MGFFDKPEDPGSLDNHRLDELESRIRQLETTVAFLVQQAGATSAPPAPGQAPVGVDVMAQIQQLAHSDKKIEAIKLYRHATGVGLKEAKDAVERM